MNMNALARQSTVLDLIEEYERKSANVEQAIKDYDDACTAIEMAGTVMGTYAGPILRHRSSVHADDMRKNLRKSGWKAIYNCLQIDRIASAKDRRLFERTVEWPDPIGWSGFNLSSCSALGLLPGQMTVLLRLLAQAR